MSLQLAKGGRYGTGSGSAESRREGGRERRGSTQDRIVNSEQQDASVDAGFNKDCLLREPSKPRPLIYGHRARFEKKKLIVSHLMGRRTCNLGAYFVAGWVARDSSGLFGP